jgi:hypothetical protein
MHANSHYGISRYFIFPSFPGADAFREEDPSGGLLPAIKFLVFEKSRVLVYRLFFRNEP